MVFTGVRSMGLGSPISMEFSMRAVRPNIKYLKPLMFWMFFMKEPILSSLFVSSTCRYSFQNDFPRIAASGSLISARLPLNIFFGNSSKE